MIFAPNLPLDKRAMKLFGGLFFLVAPLLSTGAELQDLDSTVLMQNSLKRHVSKGSTSPSYKPSQAQTQYIGRIPMYTSGRHINREEKLEWAIGFREGVDSARLDDFCHHMRQQDPDSHCVFKGDASHGSAAIVIAEARQSHLANALNGFAQDILYCEPDINLQVGHKMHDEGEMYKQEDGPIPWNLDRIDSRKGLDNTYAGKLVGNGGSGVHVYVIDTGIDVGHPEFEGRAIPTLETLRPHRYECKKGEKDCAQDEHGHGTFAAAIIGGKRFGVAKNVSLHSLKAFMDGGVGLMTWIVTSIDWVVSQGQRPAIIFMGFGAPATSHAVEQEIGAATKNGIPVIAAAGDDAADSCIYTPAAVPSALTVSASSKDDKFWPLSNTGDCVDILAPGEGVISARPGRKQSFATSTSIAAAHVAGAAALIIGAGGNTQKVREDILNRATTDLISHTHGVVNKLLYINAEK